MLYLRMNGMYVQSGEAALRMRNALHKAYAANAVRPTLAALAQAQAGNSLFMAGLGTEAQQSYELALESARRTGNAFLLSGSAGKLALLHALKGNAAAAAGYLSEHEQHLSQVSRDIASVDREAILARACLALRTLDAELVRFELSKLPRTPDMNELWPVHAYLLAAEKIILGLPSAAEKLILQLRRQRSASSRAPLARGLLDDILAAVALLERSYFSEEFDRSAIDPALLAVKNLVDGDPDAAMAQLRHGRESMGLRVGSNLAKYAEIIARSAAGPTGESVAMIRLIHEDSGGLYEIAMLKLIPGWTAIGSLLELAPEFDHRLTRLAGEQHSGPVARPALTPREREVLWHLREGKSRKEIAEETFRSENTIKTQIRSLYRKLGATSLEQMLLQARTLGL
ncbi:MAG TPA: DNA-binding response regulator [Glutamicibacter sp.]|nr:MULTISPECIES: LuxR C-terminal-related transcriptional regulator [Glutamicibacter]HCH47501.1 DNA-binding response regulator [Glutamicibacter sp.]